MNHNKNFSGSLNPNNYTVINKRVKIKKIQKPIFCIHPEMNKQTSFAHLIEASTVINKITMV